MDWRCLHSLSLGVALKVPTNTSHMKCSPIREDFLSAITEPAKCMEIKQNKEQRKTERKLRFKKCLLWLDFYLPAIANCMVCMKKFWTGSLIWMCEWEGDRHYCCTNSRFTKVKWWGWMALESWSIALSNWLFLFGIFIFVSNVCISVVAFTTA